MRKQGKGRKPNAADPLTEEDEDKLWETGQIGGHSPAALLCTIWWLNTVHLGWRGRDEHRRAFYGDFYFGVDADGTEYVEWRIERGSKTRNGERDGQEREFNQRMYMCATKTEKYPVQLFKKYMNLRPQELCEDNSPLYLQEHSNPSTTLWYKRQPVGMFMKTMAQAAGLEGKKTNHSGRKTMLTGLVQQDIPHLHIAQLSRHKNLKAVNPTVRHRKTAEEHVTQDKCKAMASV